MTKEYEIPFINRLSRRVLRSLFRGLFHLLSPVVISGLENVPSGGAYLIAINHISLYEAPLMVAFWPVAPEVAGASVVWDRPGQALLARLYQGIPVHRGQYDRRLIDATLAALQAGYPLLIAPEGGRSHTPGMRPANPGVAYLMDKAQVPVVPVGVVGTTEDYFRNAVRGQRPKLELRIGVPIAFRPVIGRGAARREQRQVNADLVMAHIAALLPADYRGVYADHEYLSGKDSEFIRT
ncbi:MAG: 1-acyl-sn-glycerol-3-phosphate acyltransferase [Anaerolineales bacterium]|nr:1-acyl-sn-glycerol-3-phosphate acyltransferase [Anaerolineales bacterium]